MPRIAAAVPFTLFGVLSTAVLVLTASDILPAEGFWRLLMLPAYVVHLALVVASVSLLGDPPAWLWVVTLPLRIIPFALFDYLLAKGSEGMADRMHER